ncbi:tRNAHis guanylyltransferase-domain-containing protein [Zopfochytrium polystomum]|nr:tRNAHis guanylyltransferase-domain-containing protein [Zopfochytrium polystomum]
MAKSKFEYVKAFEQHHTLLPETWMVVRIDGHSFHRFTSEHGFVKPNDRRALDLANQAALTVMEEFKDVQLGYGQSDEYSFLFRRKTQLYKRREAKITTTLVSLFTSAYVLSWPRYFPDLKLKYPPSFDARIVVYPSSRIVRDYFSWRQADCHINNLYNTAFWALVQDPENPMPEAEAQRILKDTDSGKKNQLLFSKYKINYNNLPEIFRKGSVVYRKERDIEHVGGDGEVVTRRKKVTSVEHIDIIGDVFWDNNPEILD